MAQRGFKLSVIGNTSLAPLGVYSKKIKDISQLKDGDKIAIPNDPTNGGRALKLFETAGFITIDPKAGYMPELKDITSNPKHLNFIEVDASQTASLLPDVAASVINSGNAIDNGFIPAKDAIYLEKLTGGSTNPYINVIVARTKDKDSPVYQKIVKAYQTDDVKQLILKDYKGSIIPAW
jgi:D-methionine transport system substrate-binding protein